MSAPPPGMGHRFASSKVLYPYPTGMSEAIGSQEHSKAVHAPHRAYEKTRLLRRSGRRSRVYLAQ